MKTYLANIIPRLREYSESLDKKEIFLDYPWALVDEESNLQKYIFRRDGSLIMSLNGKVSMGKWEYLSKAKSLLIDRITDKILLKQEFIDPAIMILNIDGHTGKTLILANENEIPNLDVVGYVRELYYEKNNIVVEELSNGEEIELWNFKGDLKGIAVSIEGKSVPDKILKFKGIQKKLVIKSSIIVQVYEFVTYDTEDGMLTVEQEEMRVSEFVSAMSHIKVGNKVYLNKKVAPTDKYKLGFLNYIHVKDGIITKLSSF